MSSEEANELFRKLERDVFDAFERPGDPNAIDRLYSNEFLSINADASLSTKQEAMEVIEAGEFPVSDSITNDNTRVRRFGDTAIITGRSRWITETVTAEVLHTQIWTQQDDQWQMVGWQGTPVTEESALGPDTDVD